MAAKKGVMGWLRDTQVWNSIFRHGPPDNPLGYASRRRNYELFREPIMRGGLKLVTIRPTEMMKMFGEGEIERC